METPLINIITRTSQRPGFFKICRESIKKQTYDRINHIVITDDAASEKYLKKCSKEKNFSFTTTQKLVRGTDGTFPYNLYFNELYKFVKNGWVLFLDDDDKFSSKQTLEQLVCAINDVPAEKREDTLFLWKVWFPDRGHVIPKNCFGKEPVQNDISTIGFCFHKKNEHLAQWDKDQCSDYRVIKRLYDHASNIVWIDKVWTRLQLEVGDGRAEDRNEIILRNLKTQILKLFKKIFPSPEQKIQH